MIGIGLPELLVILIQLLFWAGVLAIPVMLILRALRRVEERLARLEELVRRRE